MRIPLFSAVTEPPLSLLPAHEGEPAFLGGHESVAFPPVPAESEFDGLRMERRRRDGGAGGRTTATGSSAPRSAMPGASDIAVRPEALRHRERSTAERVHGDFKDSRVRGSRSARPGMRRGGRPAVSCAGSRAPTAGQQGRPQCASAGREGPWPGSAAAPSETLQSPKSLRSAKASMQAVTIAAMTPPGIHSFAATRFKRSSIPASRMSMSCIPDRSPEPPEQIRPTPTALGPPAAATFPPDPFPSRSARRTSATGALRQDRRTRPP